MARYIIKQRERKNKQFIWTAYSWSLANYSIVSFTYDYSNAKIFNSKDEVEKVKSILEKKYGKSIEVGSKKRNKYKSDFL